MDPEPIPGPALELPGAPEPPRCRSCGRRAVFAGSGLSWAPAVIYCTGCQRASSWHGTQKQALADWERINVAPWWRRLLERLLGS